MSDLWKTSGSMAAVEAETLAKVRERVKGQRIEARSLRLDAYNAGIEIAVKAIDRGKHE